jgi:hypothetical protein
MLIQFIDTQPEIEWVCPEGCFSATLIAINPVFNPDKPKQQDLKFIFEVHVPNTPEKSFRAIKKLTVSVSSKSIFKKTLEEWLGREFVRALGREFNTDLLLNQRADLVLRHIHNEGHENPYVVIDAIRSIGSINAGEGI